MIAQSFVHEKLTKVHWTISKKYASGNLSGLPKKLTSTCTGHGKINSHRGRWPQDVMRVPSLPWTLPQSWAAFSCR